MTVIGVEDPAPWPGCDVLSTHVPDAADEPTVVACAACHALWQMEGWWEGTPIPVRVSSLAGMCR